MSTRLAPGANAALAVLAALHFAFGGPAVARADPKLQAVGEVTLGFTDNAQSSPDEPLPGVPEKSSDGFAIVSPGAVLSWASPSTIHRISFTHSASVFFSESGANTSSNRLDYLAFLDLSPRVSLLLGGSAVQSAPHTDRSLNEASTSELRAMLPRTDMYLVTSADALLSEDVSRDWRAWQGGGVSVGVPLSRSAAASTVEARNHLGVERSFVLDALGAEMSSAYSSVTNGVAADGSSVGVQRQIVGAAVAIWRRDLGRDFSSRFEAGVMRVQRLSSGRGLTHPRGGASVAYAVEDGEAELAYAHRVTTNIVLGQSLLVDEVRLRGALPLADQRKLLLGASSGYQRGRLIEEDASLAARVDVVFSDVALTWQVAESLGLALRYQYTQQTSDTRSPALPLSFTRNTVMLTLAVKLPPDRELPRPYRSPRRVDRSDEVRERGARPERR